jgi:hypothetical protein
MALNRGIHVAHELPLLGMSRSVAANHAGVTISFLNIKALVNLPGRGRIGKMGCVFRTADTRHFDN